ncbi:MAG: AsmA family protein [Acidobacteriia bacterium]|nr:AsmA family protein [Terriglobia bacterium]
MRKVLLIGCGLVGFLLLAAIAFSAWFDINSWKSNIEATVSHATDMEVTIKGKIGVTRWPPLDVVLHDLQFRIRGDPILTIEAVKLSSLKLVPLFRKQVSAGACELVGPVITVVKYADGRFNFESASEKATADGGTGPATPVFVASRLSVRGGRYAYAERKTGERADIEGIEADVRDFAISPSRAETLGDFSFAGSIAGKTVRRGTLTITDVRSPITAEKGRFSLDAVTMDIFGGKGTGVVVAHTPPPAPRYEITLEVPQCRVERLLEGLGEKKFLGGEGALTMHLLTTGRGNRELTKNLSGEVSLRGNKLEAYAMDVDRLVAKVEKTRRFSLIDLGAFFIAGPLGTVATKGYDFGRAYQQAGTGHGTLERLVATWQIGNGVAEARDCALATERNRVAFVGSIDLLQESYLDAVVAVLDDRGCSRFSQRLSGPIADPKLLTMSSFQRLAGPFVGLFQKARRMLAPNAKCEVVYNGSVPQPHESAEPAHPVRR